MWDGIADFIAMGGHGAYVWSAYGVFMLAVLVELVFMKRRRRYIANVLRRRARRHPPATRDVLSEESLEP